ncbi:hypothetical protein BKA81DRAFT_176509 [Phyllosticta paracitricarpa]
MKHLDLPSVMLLVLNVLLSCLVLEVAKTESVRTKGLRSYAGQESGGSGKFPWRMEVCCSHSPFSINRPMTAASVLGANHDFSNS